MDTLLLNDIKNSLVNLTREKAGQRLIVLSSNETDFVTTFDTSITLDPNRQYEMALKEITSYNSLPNIDGTNNLFRYSHDNATSWTDIVIPTGCYELSHINDYISAKLKENGHYNTASSTPYISISANVNTLRCILTISPNYRVDFTPANSLSSLLGFNKQIYSVTTEAQNQVDIMSTSSVLVYCNHISGSYVKGKREPVIHSFSLDVIPGSKFVISPSHPTYLPLTTNVINEIRIRLADQNGKTINLRNETVTLQLHIREM